MLASSSILSRFAIRLFGKGSGRRCLPRADLRRREHAPVYCAAQVMEERALLSATFGAALSIGNEASPAYAYDVATDATGNSYVFGEFTGTIDFDPSPAVHNVDAIGTKNVYVAKYAPDDSLIWVQRMGSNYVSPTGIFSDITSGKGLALDGSGNVYVTGGFRETAAFGTTTLTTLTNDPTISDVDGFVAKLDSSGNFQWAQRWGVGASFAWDWGTGIDVDGTGNVYVTGNRLGQGLDVRKYGPSGNLAWTKFIATRNDGNPGMLDVDSSGNIFIAGGFGGTVDFDPGPRQVKVSAPEHSAFALKLTTNGDFAWVSPFVGQTVGSTTGEARATSVALDGSGNVIVGGRYSGTVDFNPAKGVTTLSPSGGGYIAKLSSSGGFLWARETGGAVSDLAVDSANGNTIYATGGFSGTVDFDPGAGVQSRTSAGESDLFVLQLTSAGNFGWVETFGGIGEERGRGIALDPTGGIHLVGEFQEIVDFDPGSDTYYLTGPTAGGTARSAFRLRLRQV